MKRFTLVVLRARKKKKEYKCHICTANLNKQTSTHTKLMGHKDANFGKTVKKYGAWKELMISSENGASHK